MTDAVPPPAKDPWKGLRGVMAGTLILQAIVVMLALPVVWRVGDGITWFSGSYVIGLAVLMILGAGLQGRPWALKFDIALQVLMVGTFVISVALGILGLIFAAVWGYILYLRNDLQSRIKAGLLPSQQISAAENAEGSEGAEGERK
ncbi:hypothetical protein FHU29_003538 [Hoyosella altamirensis]|uniref:DUF4233 domain-containing protein n=2 Tax=Hoyosella altamirensis TaxID=616997 RepID=A0A839RRX6_9ACTN|nr:hypothetical protein [Hoyosella altamirensis]